MIYLTLRDITSLITTLTISTMIKKIMTRNMTVMTRRMMKSVSRSTDLCKRRPSVLFVQNPSVSSVLVAKLVPMAAPNAHQTPHVVPVIAVILFLTVEEGLVLASPDHITPPPKTVTLAVKDSTTITVAPLVVSTTAPNARNTASA